MRVLAHYNWTIETLLSQADRLPQLACKALPDRWTRQQESAFIESVFLDYPMPVLAFSYDGGSPRSVIDGRSRLKALLRFWGNKETPGMPLEGLSSYMNGFTLDTLDDEHLRVFLNHTCPVVAVLHEQSDKVLHDMRLRLNGGTDHV